MKEERKRILKMVEEGKLTVDEALTLLEELENAQQTMKQKQEQMIHELSSGVHFEEAKKEDSRYAKYQSTKEKFFEFVDSAFKKIKDFDFDLNFVQSVEISHIFHHGNADVKDIDIDVANGSVKITAWDQPDVRVECEAKVYRVDSQDHARQSFLSDTDFSVEGGKLRFLTHQKWMKVDAVMFVPKAQYETARIRVFNGPIVGEAMNVQDLRVKTANGKIILDKIEGEKAVVEAANGKVHFNGNLEEVEAETINGTIRLEGDFKKAEVQSFSGNISFDLKGADCEWLHAKTTTGAIDVQIPEETPVNGELKSNLGGFHLKLVGVQILEEKSDVMQKSLRFQSIQHPDKMLKIYAETKTGTITVQKAYE